MNYNTGKHSSLSIFSPVLKLPVNIKQRHKDTGLNADEDTDKDALMAMMHPLQSDMMQRWKHLHPQSIFHYRLVAPSIQYC